MKPGMLQIYSLSLAREAISLIDVPHAHNVSLKLLEAWTAILRELELEVVPSLADQVAVRKVKFCSSSQPAATEVPRVGQDRLVVSRAGQIVSTESLDVEIQRSSVSVKPGEET